MHPFRAIMLGKSKRIRVEKETLIVVSGLWRALRVQVGATRTPSLLSEVLVGFTGGITGGLVGLHLWCQRSGVRRAASTSRASGRLLSLQSDGVVIEKLDRIL